MPALLKKTTLGEQRVKATQVLQKAGVKIGSDKFQAVAVFDRSGSTDFAGREFYSIRRGESQSVMSAIATRVLAIGMQLDDNKQIPVVQFSSGASTLEDITPANLETYIADQFSSRANGGTSYPSAMKEVVKGFDRKVNYPGLVWFFTDGECNDHEVEATKRLLKEYSSLPIFWSFVGIHVSGDKPDFGFLKDLDNMKGRVVDNAGFMEVNVDKITDEELYTAMLSEASQFPGRVAGSNGKVHW